MREWKRRSAVALDDTARATADAKVRAYQAAIRDHVATTSDQPREPDDLLSCRGGVRVGVSRVPGQTPGPFVSWG